MEGYKEAEKLDKLINDLAKEHPIEGNERQWLKFTRTVESSLGILRASASEALGLYSELHPDDLEE